MPRSPVDRRTFLKALLATTGGLTASAFLPARWTKPLVKTGVLPVHAQTSGTLYLTASNNGADDNLEGRVTLQNIWAFVSTTRFDSVPSRQAPSAPPNGVGNIPVTLNFLNLSQNGLSNQTLPVTLYSSTNPLGRVEFDDQVFNYTNGGYQFRLIFTSPNCANSPVWIPFQSNQT